MELLIKKAMKGDAEAFVQLMELNEVSMYKTAKAILKHQKKNQVIVSHSIFQLEMEKKVLL